MKRPDFPPFTLPHYPNLEPVPGRQLPLPTLADWIHGCADDAATRTAVVTTFVLSACQLAGHNLTHRMPSFILVRPSDPQARALGDLASRFVTEDRIAAKEYRVKSSSSATPEQALKTMKFALSIADDLRKGGLWTAEASKVYGDNFFAAQNGLYGTGASRPYAEAWHMRFGLITDRDDRLILHLNTLKDVQAFRRDVMDKNAKLTEPTGYCAGLIKGSKEIAIAGAMSPEQCHAGFVRNLVDLPFPVLLLPQPGAATFTLPEDVFLRALIGLSRGKLHGPVQEPYNVLPMPWFEHYFVLLRQRLHHLPTDYEHAFQRLARQLPGACVKYVQLLGTCTAKNECEIVALAFDLFAYALRGVTISMAGLAWYGLGFDPGCAPQEASRVLEYLRANGPMSSSDLLRKARLTKELRDVLVKCLVEQDLVEIDGKIIRAKGYDEFVEALYARKEFLEPENYWSGLNRNKQSVA
jgi:hypothetical protein